MKHPRLQKATYKKSQNREYIQTTIPVTNNKDYDTWAKNIKESPVKDSNYALNPLKHSYKKAGMCGNSGTATVRFCLLSYNTKITPFCSATKLNKEAQHLLPPSLPSLSSGIFSTV